MALPACTLAEAGATLTEATGTCTTVMADVPLCPSLVAVTEATGTLETVMLAVPLCPSLVAVIVADPIATPVTRPLVVTVATEVLLLDHATARPESGLPFASFGVAVSCTVCPTCMLAEPG